MYFGVFYFDTKELFLMLAAFLLGVAMLFHWDILWFDKGSLFTFILLILVTKGLLPSIHNEAFFILAIISIFALLFFSLFPVVIFYFLSFLLFRLFKVI